MKIDLDNLATELSKSAQSLEKTGIPPKVYSKLRQWLKHMKSSRINSKQLSQSLAQKAEDLMHFQSLAKNDIMASFYENGIMKMDFGAGVNDGAKKAALRWARKRGLKVVEATLSKSEDSPKSYVLSAVDEIGPYGRCIKRSKWSL